MKRALNSLTETAAVTWAPDNIRGNAITPGGTTTHMMNSWESASPGIIDRITASIPLGRRATPHEVAEAATWLLSPRAAVITGATLPVDDGGVA